MGLTFDKEKILPIKRELKKYNTRIISLLAIYENRKTMIFKVLGSVIYCIMEDYLCVDYLCRLQGQIFLEHKVFKTPHSMIF